MDVVSVREFARRIGVSLTAVQKGIRNGRIEAVYDKNNPDKIVGVDYDSQASAWVDNSKAPGRKPHNAGGGRPRKDGQEVAKPKTNGGDDIPDVFEHQEPQAHGGSLKRTHKNEGEGTLADIQKKRELVKLQLDIVKLKESQGELVNAASVKSEAAKLAGGLISTLYNIPERVSDEIAGMSDPHAIHALLVKEIDNAVEDIRRQYVTGHK